MAHDWARREKQLRRIKRLAHLLDHAITVPFTNWKFGVDPLLGLIPGVGDFVAAALATSIVLTAKRMGAPNHVVGRMAANVLLDWLGGTVPVVGDVFDFAFKCNIRNVRLLEEWLNTNRE